MAKKYILEYYDAFEVEQEIGVPFYKCYFAEGIPSSGFATLYCDDETLEGCMKEYPNDRYIQNEVDWINYFRALGYKDEVKIKVY